LNPILYGYLTYLAIIGKFENARFRLTPTNVKL